MSRITSEFTLICEKNKQNDAFIYISDNEIVKKSFNDLNRNTVSAICCLQKNGVKKGDRILAFAAPSYDLCVFMLAAMSFGASIMYVDIWAKKDRLENAILSCAPKYIAVSRKTKHLKIFFGGIKNINNILYVDKIPEACDFTPIEEICESAEALLTMTTGSSGIPKIAVRTHRHLFEQAQLVNKNMDEKFAAEYVLTTSFMYIFSNILNGFTTVLPHKDFKKMSEIPITMLMTTPDFCLKTANVYPKLKKVYFGGAILTFAEASEIFAKFGKAEIEYIYGATECNLITTTKLCDYIEHLQNDMISVLGKTVRGVGVIIGQNNEIFVTSGALLEEYINCEASNKHIDENGTVWHNTGDAGAFLENSLIYYGRADKFFIIDGKKIYYSQIEQKINVLFSLRKCAVLEADGKLFLFIETKIAVSEIQSFLKENYSFEKANIIVLKQIPCDVKHHTKINYKALEKKIRRK